MRKLLFATVASVGIAMPAMASPQVSESFDNSAIIDQLGVSNEAIINQRVDGRLNGENLAEIKQDGTDNFARIRQISATSKVSGAFDNDAYVEQEADGSSATVMQIHDYGSMVGLKATIKQNADDADVTLRQRGDDNETTITQTRTANGARAVVRQNGIENEAVVRQSGADSEIMVRQGVYTNDDAGSNDSTSSATQSSLVRVRSAGDYSLIQVNQIGFDQVAKINESGMSNNTDVNMMGDFNRVEIDQHGTNGTIVTDQYSLSNRITIEQDVTSINDEVTVLQTGYRTFSKTKQSDTGGLGGGNLIDVVQTGDAARRDDIFSSVEQDGAYNEAYVEQYSDYALSTIGQTGTGHFAKVSQ